MNARRWPWLAAAGLLVLLGTTAPAPAQVDEEFYRKPETAADYWRAVRFEMSQGKFDLAARLLQGFLDAKPTDEDYAKIEADQGIAVFLRLRNVPKWSANPDAEKAARATAEAVIQQAIEAINRNLADPVRIGRFIRNLAASPEEREYALAQLRRSGVKAMPTILDILQNRPDEEQRTAILETLPALPDSTVAPIVASLDTPDRELKAQLLTVLAARRDLPELTGFADTNVLPTLAYLAAAPTEGGAVRTLSADLHRRLSERLRLRELPARTELTEAAETFLNHKAKFRDPVKLTVWRWDGAKAVPVELSPSQAEEYYGLRYARRAVDLARTDEAAQVTFLTLAIEKAVGRAGLAAPLATAEPGVFDLLVTAPPALLRSVLDRALVEGRTGVVLAIVRVLGERGEGALMDVRKEPRLILVRALDYPDRRVRLAAAAALARLPATVDHQSHARIVEILRRALGAEPDAPPAEGAASRPKVLIGDPDGDRAAALARMSREAGYDPVVASTGRDVIRRLLSAADIDVVLVDHQLPAPELPKLLAEIRTDARTGGLPVRVMLGTRVDLARLPDATARARRLAEPYRGIEIVAEPLSPGGLASVLRQSPERPAEEPLTDEEKAAAARRAVELLRLLGTGVRPGYDVRPAARELLAALRNDDLAPAAIDVVERFDGKDVQSELAAVVLNAARPLPLRLRAVDAIITNAQKDGLILPDGRRKELADLLADEKAEPELRARVAALLGRQRPDPKQIGDRLLQYVPPEPAAPAAPPAKE